MHSADELTTAACLNFRKNGLISFLLFWSLFLTGNISGQTKVACNEITADMGFTVRSVRIAGRWVPEEIRKTVDQLIGVGQPFDPAKVGIAQELVRTELIKGENQYGIKLIGSTSVLFITSDICAVSDTGNKKEVEIVIHPYYLRIDLYNVGNNILPVPRSPKASFFQHVPSALLATAPLASLNNDGQYGPSVLVQTTTDLLHISGSVKPDKRSDKLRLNLGLDARKSFRESFHNIDAGLDLIHPVYGDTTIGWNFGVHYARSLQPLGLGEYKRELTRIYGAIQGSLKTSCFSKFALGGVAQFLQNRYDTEPNFNFQNPENNYEVYALSDGRLGHGFTRLGIWFDAVDPKGDSALASYQRLAARIGYAVALGTGHNSIDLETALGSGYTWGAPPPYNQFFAGNAPWNFLYESFASARNRATPDGPIVRSLGEHEGGLRSSGSAIVGGTSYWHLNLNFSIPIPKWARPLIPDIVISETPRRSTIRSKLKGAVESSTSFIIEDLVNNRGLPDDEETEKIAERIVDKDIRPTVNYLADRANLYAIKPLLLFDMARINKRSFGDKTWAAAGIGVQMNIVNARLETGYMQTLFPDSDSSKGNFFLRFTVQNFY